MSLRLRHLRIRIHTNTGPFGVDLPFTDGLNLIRADNTSGKSTCFQSIVYALGLDAMLTPRQQDLPLTHALTTRILDAKREQESVVRSTELWLEIESHNGRVATIYRPIKGLGDPRHVTVFDGQPIDSAQNGTDMLVRVRGSATSDLGFHRWLAEDFLQWKLPRVEHTDGRPGVLYLEAIFPLFFVEQRFGWSRIQGNMPYRFGIRDVARRATEFVLNLTIAETQLRRASLTAKREELALRYSASAKSIEALAALTSCSVRGIPESLPSNTLKPSVLVVNNNLWKPINQRLQELDERIDSTRSAAEKKTRAGSDKLLQLQRKQFELRREIEGISAQRSTEQQERNSLSRRQADLAEQISKLKDLRLLSKVGGNANESMVAANCPTCWQPVADSIRPDVKSVMSLEETIGFAEAELALIEEAKERSNERRQALLAKSKDCEARLEELDAAVDAFHNFEGADVTELSEYLSMQQERLSLKRLEEQFSRYVSQANSVIQEALAVAEEIKNLPTSLLQTDEAKISTVEASFKEQEREYGFKSLPVSELSVSRETYKPSVGDFELGYEMSASDAIRTIWSYLLALIEAKRAHNDMNHPGLLVFDEPKQQSMKDFSFGQLLRHAAISRHFKEQIIFFTSESRASIDEKLRGEEFSMVTFDGQILQPLG